jgi:hypothetical protein
MNDDSNCRNQVSMTGIRSPRSMKRGPIPNPVCTELRLFSREAITLKFRLLSIQFTLVRSDDECNGDISTVGNESLSRTSLKCGRNKRNLRRFILSSLKGNSDSVSRASLAALASLKNRQPRCQQKQKRSSHYSWKVALSSYSIRRVAYAVAQFQSGPEPNQSVCCTPT